MMQKRAMLALKRRRRAKKVAANLKTLRKSQPTSSVMPLSMPVGGESTSNREKWSAEFRGIGKMRWHDPSNSSCVQRKRIELLVKAAPRAVDERDDKMLDNLLSTLENQNKEVDGDEDEGEEEDGMAGPADIS